MELVEPMVGHGRPWEVEVLAFGFVKAMGGGGMVEMVEMVEMYLLNKYTRHQPWLLVLSQRKYLTL
jgi:hypothetical protein